MNNGEAQPSHCSWHWGFGSQVWTGYPDRHTMSLAEITRDVNYTMSLAEML
jgi:hypothetical protein